MKYKIGDRVKIKSLDWYNENKDIHGTVDCGAESFLKSMSQYCGREATITNIVDFCQPSEAEYVLDVDSEEWNWTDDMFEGNSTSTNKESCAVQEIYQIYEVSQSTVQTSIGHVSSLVKDYVNEFNTYTAALEFITRDLSKGDYQIEKIYRKI